MALARKQGLVHRLYLASPLAFEDWQNPTVDELNANPTNNPAGLIFNLSCALNQDGTTFDLGDPETDDSLTFCQVAGTAPITGYSPEIVYQIERSSEPWVISNPASEDVANLAFSLLAWRGVEYFAIMSVGRGPEEPFEIDDRIKMARVVTDHLIDETGSGENVRGTATMADRGDVLWNARLTA